MFSTNTLVGGVTKNASTVAAPWPRNGPSACVYQLESGAEGGLDARIHHVDGVDLVEDQMGEIANGHEAGGEPRHAVVAAEQRAVDPGREKAAEHGRQQECQMPRWIAEMEEDIFGR
jgi:hypothetical protein